jgi:hypothetical protein
MAVSQHQGRSNQHSHLQDDLHNQTPVHPLYVVAAGDRDECQPHTEQMVTPMSASMMAVAMSRLLHHTSEAGSKLLLKLVSERRAYLGLGEQ